MEGLRVLEEAKAMKAWLVEKRRWLHRHPEPGLEERETADYIQAVLAELGIPSSRSGTAVIGLVEGKPGPRTVAIRADIDALPIEELRQSDYRSEKPGMMHACGHDAHAAILLGAARWLSEHRADFAGKVKLLFQPAEETVGGAKTMVKEGCLEDPHVDAVIGLHVMPYLAVGEVELKKGALCGCSTTLDIQVRGKGGHGAYPETGIDAVLIAANLVTALDSLVARAVSPLDHAVLGVGTIQGGSRSNIIAEEVSMKATLRAALTPTRDLLIEKARALVEGIPAAFGGRGSMEVSYGYEALINHDAVVDILAQTAEDILGKSSIRWKEKPSMGVEDFSFFIKDRPGAFFHLGCGNPAAGIDAALHSSTFDIDEDCLPLGVAMHVAAARRLLEKDVAA